MTSVSSPRDSMVTVTMDSAPFGALGHPRVLDAARPIDLHEASVVRPSAAFVFYRMVKEAVYNWIQNHALGSEPRSTRTFRIDPDVKDLLG